MLAGFFKLQNCASKQHLPVDAQSDGKQPGEAVEVKGVLWSQVTGNITYNGYRLNEFVVRRTCSYVDQYDNHTPELTVRETLDFAARCQTAGLGKQQCM